MTYQTASENMPARGMSITSAPFTFVRKGLEQVASLFKSFGNAIVYAGEASSRVHRIEALEAKTDVELANMGIKRDEIVHHVFKDLYYI